MAITKYIIITHGKVEISFLNSSCLKLVIETMFTFNFFFFSYEIIKKKSDYYYYC